MNRGELPPEIEFLKKEGVKLFEDRFLIKKWRDNFVGISWNENGNVLCGAVDNLLVKEDKLIVLDYKTRGFPLKEDSVSYYKNQLNNPILQLVPKQKQQQ